MRMGATASAHVLDDAPPATRTRYISDALLTSLYGRIDSNGSLSSFADAQTVYTQYGMETPQGIRVTTTTGAANPFYPGYNGDAVTLHTPRYKRLLKTWFDELSKYPPSIIVGGGLVRMTVVENIVSEANPTRDMGGLSISDRTFLDTYGFSTIIDGRAWDDGNNGVKFLTNHELFHVIHLGGTYASEINALQATFTAWNPEPYLGDDALLLDPDVRPAGHFRYYGRYDFREDVADLNGFIFTTELQGYAEAALAADSILRDKVGLLKDWYASKEPVMGTQAYWEGIHVPM